jgi:hypothetical protein
MSADPTIDRLILASVTDGEFRKEDLVGLSRLSPFLYLGGTKTAQATVGGYYGCPAIAHFRTAVRQISPFPPIALRGTKCPHPCAEACVALPNMFDLDTRNLYFGQLNVSPASAHFKVGQSYGGYGVKGLPMRLQQVHFRAFHPRGQSDEYAAFFLTSNPVGKYKAMGTTVVLPAVVINSDFELQTGGQSEHLDWTHNWWTIDGSRDTAIADHEGRLIIGDPLGVIEGQMDGYGNLEPLTWKRMYDCYDSFAGPKNQVYRMILDGEGFIIRQNILLPDRLDGAYGGKGQEGSTVGGWGYDIPMDVIISNRYRFHLPTYWPSEEVNPDHMVIEYYAGSYWTKDKLLLRPPPQTDTVIGCKDLDRGWEPIYAMTLAQFCELFPRMVTRVENRGIGLYEHYVDIKYNENANDGQGSIVVKPGCREIIPFTACEGSLESDGSCSGSNASAGPGSTATEGPGSSHPDCSYPESSTIPCPPRAVAECGDCDQVC